MMAFPSNRLALVGTAASVDVALAGGVALYRLFSAKVRSLAALILLVNRPFTTQCSLQASAAGRESGARRPIVVAGPSGVGKGTCARLPLPLLPLSPSASAHPLPLTSLPSLPHHCLVPSDWHAAQGVPYAVRL